MNPTQARVIIFAGPKFQKTLTVLLLGWRSSSSSLSFYSNQKYLSGEKLTDLTVLALTAVMTALAIVHIVKEDDSNSTSSNSNQNNSNQLNQPFFPESIPEVNEAREKLSKIYRSIHIKKLDPNTVTPKELKNFHGLKLADSSIDINKLFIINRLIEPAFFNENGEEEEERKIIVILQENFLRFLIFYEIRAGDPYSENGPFPSYSYVTAYKELLKVPLVDIEIVKLKYDHAIMTRSNPVGAAAGLAVAGPIGSVIASQGVVTNSMPYIYLETSNPNLLFQEFLFNVKKLFQPNSNSFKEALEYSLAPNTKRDQEIIKATKYLYYLLSQARIQKSKSNPNELHKSNNTSHNLDTISN